ncbi:class I SAM-dependent rRNA methyltransferase [Aerococcus loyolae]|uniref:Class I SAM-dependent rRNA methyltransferase n=1 Tax=Aerococcus urinae TaxID=1376 RepID=A0A2I1L644_9LACT|nr:MULTISPECIES: class I SAM-dependent rRNA methyltransferase [Aerococcus]MCY3067732.1 class I SAM-dependent rRNA methyltransferase [Aerococcus mictus]MCY3080367.1 class I SAM-dependent rRNA methyltransferase [Aerococcus mictus]MDK6728465.1 class I SAM-dependent rRNA methyltransferase [Aerococcus urinae]MDK7909395.1 class I SAM-dependent rRNA methyltransferase [Aerococcus urinae]MDK8609696.1 class I SAM-dependent rRNA methyltransferase [Aerococcus urinae]
MRTLTLRKRASQAARAGRLLLKEDDFIQPVHFEEGDLVQIKDHQGDFLALAYLARQHKGIGWIYSYDRQTSWGQDFFQELFQRAKDKRQALFYDDLTTAFRVFNGEGDGLGGLTVDYYAGYLLLQWYSLGIYQNKAAIIAALAAVYPEALAMEGKNRFKSQQVPHKNELLWGQATNQPVLIKENGINYVTRLSDGWMTGIFLDQRRVRDYLMSRLALGKRVLNTFSYTGAFSLAAAMGGALSTTSVDLANRTRELTAEQFEANGIDLGDNHKVYVMDTFDYFAYANRHDLTYDVIVMDPPSFARNGKQVFKVTEQYPQLVQDALAILSPGGYLICSTNAANYSPKTFQADILKGAQAGNEVLELVESFHLPEDFPVPPKSPESDYLKVRIYQKQ